jgi:hypothetical protein
MKTVCIVFCALLYANPVAALEREWTVSAEEWARPRSGELIAGMSPVLNSVQALLEQPGYRLVLRYPGGEAGVLWAREIRDWLVSLGLSSELVAMEAGNSRDDVVTILLQQREGF